MRYLVPLALPIAVAACSGGGTQSAVDPRTWTCQSLVGPVIEMSRERTPRILEINRTQQVMESPNSEIICQGWAEMSQGGTLLIRYGARVSEGGNILLEYSGG